MYFHYVLFSICSISLLIYLLLLVVIITIFIYLFTFIYSIYIFFCTYSMSWSYCIIICINCKYIFDIQYTSNGKRGEGTGGGFGLKKICSQWVTETLVLNMEKFNKQNVQKKRNNYDFYYIYVRLKWPPTEMTMPIVAPSSFEFESPAVWVSGSDGSKDMLEGRSLGSLATLNRSFLLWLWATVRYLGLGSELWAGMCEGLTIQLNIIRCSFI